MHIIARTVQKFINVSGKNYGLALKNFRVSQAYEFKCEELKYLFLPCWRCPKDYRANINLSTRLIWRCQFCEM